MFLRTQTTAGRTYLLVVESERVDGRIKQRVLHRLGRLDQLQASGQLDNLIASLGRLSDKLAVLGAHSRGESLTTRTRSIGAALIFERLWQDSGIAAVSKVRHGSLAAARHDDFLPKFIPIDSSMSRVMTRACGASLRRERAPFEADCYLLNEKLSLRSRARRRPAADNLSSSADPHEAT